MLWNWLQGAELEQVKGPLLVRVGWGYSAESRKFGNSWLDDLLGLRGQGLEETPEVLDGKAILGELFASFGQGDGRGLGGGDDALPGRLAGPRSLLGEQHRRQCPTTIIIPHRVVHNAP